MALGPTLRTSVAAVLGSVTYILERGPPGISAFSVTSLASKQSYSRSRKCAMFEVAIFDCLRIRQRW